MHTPGPWQIDEIMHVFHERKDGRTEYVAYAADTQAMEPNASLIAAAPDLLEALERLLGCPDECECGCQDMARAAIAKAKGEA